jgi:hypothetical protein
MLEDRLADAYREAAETVRPETIPAPPDLSAQPGRRYRLARLSRPARRHRANRPARPARPASPARPATRLAMPLAAAAAVAAIAVAATVVVPRVWPGHQAGPADGNAPPPRYYAAVVSAPRSTKTVVDIVNAATGRVTGQLGSPRPGIYFQEVATLGGDQSFVAAAAVPVAGPVAQHCRTWLYRFRITAAGRPAGLRSLGARGVAGYPSLQGLLDFQSLAGSADGSTVAYSTAECSGANPGVKIAGQISVLHLRSRRVSTWRYQFATGISSLSLSANGHLLGLDANPSAGGPTTASWVVPTDSPSGSLQRYGHRVTATHLPRTKKRSWAWAVALSPSGRTMLTAIGYPGGHQHLLALRDYQTRTGRLLRTVRILREHGGTYDNPALALSASARYVLLYSWNAEEARLDLATGRLVILRTRSPYVQAAQSAAW